MKKLVILMFALVCFVPSAWASSLEEFGRSMSYFYTAPSKDAFALFQEDADRYRNEFYSRKNGAELLVSVMIARISQKYDWPIRSHAFGEKAKEIVIGKSNLAKYVSDDSLVDPGKLDIWWASFFATGDKVYLEKIFRYAGEDIKQTDNKENLLVYGPASWSFKANSRQHEKVRLFAEEKQKEGSYSEHKTKYLQECLSYANKK